MAFVIASSNSDAVPLNSPIPKYRLDFSRNPLSIVLRFLRRVFRRNTARHNRSRSKARQADRQAKVRDEKPTRQSGAPKEFFCSRTINALSITECESVQDCSHPDRHMNVRRNRFSHRHADAVANTKSRQSHIHKYKCTHS